MKKHGRQNHREQDIFTMMTRGEKIQGYEEQNLVFGKRPIKNDDGEVVGEQLFSELNNGEVVFPRRERWRPSVDRVIRCYVSTMETKGGKVLHHATPCDIEDARRHKEISPPSNSVKVLPLNRDGKGGFIGYVETCNRKTLLVPKDSGIQITDEEIENGMLIPLMVEEKDSAFVAHYRISEKAMRSILGTDDTSVNALERRMEAVGMESEFQRLWVYVEGAYYNAPEELCVKPDATMKEIKVAHRKRAAELSPDKCIARANRLARMIIRTDASVKTIATINRDFKVCQASYEHMRMLRKREDAVKRYAQAGADALGSNIAANAITDGAGVLEILLGDLADAHEAFANGDGEELVNRGLEAIGYPGVTAEAELSRNVAVTLAGWLVEERSKREAAAKATEAKPAETVPTPTTKKAPRKPAATPRKKKVAESAVK